MSEAAGGLRNPRLLFPFILITLIWGSTWIVIKDQLGSVPPPWSVTYRFVIAAAGMFVYAAEHYVTSGLVAMVFALLMVPNSALAWIFLKHRVTGRFVLGSAVALAGVSLLFVQEMRGSDAEPRAVLIGIGLTVAGVLAASVANIMQASQRLRERPIASMLAWGMVYGVAANALFASTVYGPPVVEARAGYWIGLVYLGLFASALAFTIYFGIIRAIGPGKAAYSSLIVPIVAMALSTVFEGYAWSPLAIAGGLLAMAGMVIALKARPRNPAA